MPQKVVDLTLEIHPDMQVFQGYPRPVILPWTKIDFHGYEAEALFMISHTGTHMDAPAHFKKGGVTIDRLPLRRFVAKGVLLDLSPAQPRKVIARNEIQKAEERATTRLRGGEAVILRMGWEEHLDKNDYLSDNPGLSLDAAEYLAGKAPSLVGVDSANIDHPGDSKFPVHNTLLLRSIPIVENLCNLSELTGRRFTFIGVPLKIRGGTGSPIRAVAILR